MDPSLVFSVMALGWMGYLAVEGVLLRRRQRDIPLRIAVTGTRGKTTVVRLLASVLRKDGRVVLAKTTGSEAAYVLPDGSEEPVRRRGRPSIIEQKRLMRRAAGLGAQAVVAEVMSVNPDCHRVEANALLRPHLVLVTNFRVDHSEAQGSTREAVARTLVLDIPPGGRALVPEEEWEQAFQEEVVRMGGEVVMVPAETGSDARQPRSAPLEFSTNLELVRAAALSLGVSDEAVEEGIREARGDIGRLRIWRYPPASPQSWLVANAFAANDPLSTFLVQDRIFRLTGLPAERCTGLLNLRWDRGDRTLQWAEALAGGGLDRFQRLYLSGGHAHALRRRLRALPGGEKVRVLGRDGPSGIMETLVGSPGVATELEPGTTPPAGDAAPAQTGPGPYPPPRNLLFGFGNMAGLGEEMVRHWEMEGEPHGV